jgi:hypothetical protein
MAVMILDQVTKEELIKEVTDKLLQEIAKVLDKKTTDAANDKEWLTANEVKGLLKISHTTLWNWSRRGIVKSHKISGRLRYKRSEVLTALKRKEYKAG